jgi:hypothetical protein
MGRFTYANPTITNLTPAAGPIGGGQAVTVSGSDFGSGTTAAFGGTSGAVSNLTADSFTFTTPVHGAGYVQLQATDSVGSSTLPNTNAGYIYDATASYVPNTASKTPFRILDTRSGLCGVNTCHTLGQGQALTLQLDGYTDPTTGESIPALATAVVINVVAVNGSSFSLLTVWPNGTAQPTTSNLNFNGGTNTANLVSVAVGQSSLADTHHEIQIYNSLGNVDVVADVEGYFTTPSGVTGEFHPIAPLRVCDTRHGQSANVCNGNGTSGSDNVLGAGQTTKVNVTGKPAGVGGSPVTIPTDGTAAAAALNLTAVSGTSSTLLSVFPTNSSGNCAYGNGNPAPPSTNINVGSNTNQANRVFVPLGPSTTGGPNTDVCVYNSLGNINFILDANGWFGTASASAGEQFQPIGPSRVCDTRSGQGTLCSGHSITQNSSLTVAVAGQGGIPTSGPTPLAIVANMTAVSGSGATFLSAYPADVALPNASDINAGIGQNLPNLIVTKLATGSPTGDIDVYNNVGTIDVIIDVCGWFQ